LWHAIPESWRGALDGRVDPDLLIRLEAFVADARTKGPVYPPEGDVFNALKRTSLARVKVVILGQDPYHGAGEAHGLSFSVPRGVKVPPSLRNLYKELQSDLGIAPPAHGNLEHWADEGVLLLNTVLTVEEDKPGSHRGQGWEQVTGAVLQEINEKRDRVVFILLGKDAQKKAAIIDTSKHIVLSAPHPSPLSASTGFFGCKLFSRVNDALQTAGRGPIDWKLPP
jgi:uracil-DNA glycosylase